MKKKDIFVNLRTFAKQKLYRKDEDVNTRMLRENVNTYLEVYKDVFILINQVYFS